MSTKKSKFVNSVTYSHESPIAFEHPSGASLTVAGESYTVRELFERHLRGQLPPDVSRQSYYADTQDFDSIDFQALKNADVFEKAEMLEEVQLKAKKAQEAILKWQAEQDAMDDDDPTTTSPPKKPKKADKASDKEQGSKRSDATDATASDAEKG